MAIRRATKSFINEREMLQPANNSGIKPNATDGQKYSIFGDARLRSLAAQIAALIAIVFVSGKTMEYFVDTYVMGPSTVQLSDLPKGGEKNYKLALLKGEELGSAFGGMSIYKSENSLVEELENLQKLTVQDLKLKTFFARGRNYFIQVIGVDDQFRRNTDETYPEDRKKEQIERMDPHYYHLKKLCRKKGTPLFPYKIDARDFKDE